MNRKDLFYFAGKTLSMNDDPILADEITSTIRNNIIDWEAFVSLISHHLITPAIYSSFRRNGILSEIPEQLAIYLEEIYGLNNTRNIRISEQIKEIGLLLGNENVKVIFLKGSGNLIDNLYDHPGDRIIGDIDFLVRQDDYLKTIQLFLEAGYKPPEAFFGNINYMKHYPRLTHPEKTATVEIHRLPVHERYRKSFSPIIAFNNCLEIEAFPGCSVLTDEYKVIMNFIHCQLMNKGHSRGIVPLRDLNDIRLLSKRVGLSKVQLLIHEKRKANAYFYLMEKINGTPMDGIDRADLTTRIFIKKHDLNYESQLFFKTNTIIFTLYNRIILGYFGRFFKSIYSRKERELIIQFITNREFMKRQLASWKTIFK